MYVTCQLLLAPFWAFAATPAVENFSRDKIFEAAYKSTEKQEKKKEKEKNGGMAKSLLLLHQTLIKVRAFSQMASSSKGFRQRSKNGVETWTTVKQTPGISLSGCFFFYI